MTDRLPLALVGCGWISGNHIRAYKDLVERGCRDFEVVACCDPQVDKAAAAAKEIAAFQGGAPRVFASVAELVAAHCAEAADVCVPHCFHHTVAIELLQGGLHVLLEKPLGLTVRASRKIIEAAEAAGRVLATAENTRRTLGSRACRWAMCEAGMIGTPRAAHIQHVSYGPFDMNDPKFKWRGVKVLTGGGMIMDSGAHFADMMLQLFGEPEEVYCHMATHDATPIPAAPIVGDARVDVEDTWHAVLGFANDVRVTWTYSRVFHGEPLRAGSYYGTSGTLEDKSFVFHCFERGATLRQAGGATLESEAIEQAYMASLSDADKERIFPHGATHGFSVEIADFVRAVRTGAAPEIDGGGGLRAKALCESCYESATAGRPVCYQDVLSGTIRAYQEPIDAYWKI